MTRDHSDEPPLPAESPHQRGQYSALPAELKHMIALRTLSAEAGSEREDLKTLNALASTAKSEHETRNNYSVLAEYHEALQVSASTEALRKSALSEALKDFDVASSWLRAISDNFEAEYPSNTAGNHVDTIRAPTITISAFSGRSYEALEKIAKELARHDRSFRQIANDPQQSRTKRDSATEAAKGVAESICELAPRIKCFDSSDRDLIQGTVRREFIEHPGSAVAARSLIHIEGPEASDEELEDLFERNPLAVETWLQEQFRVEASDIHMASSERRDFIRRKGARLLRNETSEERRSVASDAIAALNRHERLANGEATRGEGLAELRWLSDNRSNISDRLEWTQRLKALEHYGTRMLEVARDRVTRVKASELSWQAHLDRDIAPAPSVPPPSRARAALIKAPRTEAVGR